MLLHSAGEQIGRRVEIRCRGLRVGRGGPGTARKGRMPGSGVNFIDEQNGARVAKPRLVNYRQNP